jgi:PAS domain S-box-containing protein
MSDFFHWLPGLFVVVDTNFKIVSGNKAFVEYASPRHGDIISKEIFTLFNIPRHVLQAALDNVRINKQPTSPLLFAEGDKTARIEFTPVLENDNVSFIILKIEHGPGNVQNATDTHDLFANLFEFNPAALAISRLSDATIINVNEALLRLLDFSDKAEVVGKTAESLNLMDNPEQRSEVIRQLKENKKVMNTEGSLRTRKGNVKWTSMSLLLVNLGDEPCLIAVMIDITERKIAEDKLKSINAELENLITERSRKMLETELEYHSVIEQATDGIFISDVQGKYVDVNPSACALLGYTKEEFLKMTTQDVLQPEEARRNPPKFAELLDGKKILSRRNLIRKDGSVVPVEINARMLTNGRMLGMVRDITERQREEEAIQNMNAALEEKVKERTAELEAKVRELKESEDKFEKAFKASSAGITITRLSDSRYTEVNDAFLQMIGCSREEVLHHSSTELGLIVNIKQREEVLKALIRDGSFKHMEMTVKRKSGELIEVLSSIETIQHGGEKFAINIIYDITELKHAQQKLEIANRELEAFTYSVSHDLRAPLRSIIGYSEILKEDFDPVLNDEGKRHLNKIQGNASKMGRLIDDLLAFSKLGKQELAKAHIHTDAMVEKNIHDLVASTQTNAEIMVDALAPSFGDVSMLNQVWQNLISNAIKYSSKKESPVIHIGSFPNDGEVVFYVRDNGAGFNMDYGHKLFGVFQRLHKTTEFEGTGVGLALTKRIIDKHGGRIWAEGKDGEGATFFFSLPPMPED